MTNMTKAKATENSSLTDLGENLGQASVPAVKQYLQLAAEQKLDIDDICQRVGLDLALLSDNSQHISGLHFQQLIALLIE